MADDELSEYVERARSQLDATVGHDPMIGYNADEAIRATLNALDPELRRARLADEMEGWLTGPDTPVPTGFLAQWLLDYQATQDEGVAGSMP